MQRLIFSLSAQRDLNEIFDYIDRDKPIAASNWIGLIEEKCKLIAETPEFGETRHEYGASIRSSTIGRYVIFIDHLATA